MSKEQTRKLFNRGSRKINHKDGSFLPQTACAFSNDVAEKLLKLYGSELIDMENVTVEALTGQDIQSKVEADSRKQDEEIAKRLAYVRARKAKTAYDEALAADMSENEAREIAGMELLPEVKKIEVETKPLEEKKGFFGKKA